MNKQFHRFSTAWLAARRHRMKLRYFYWLEIRKLAATGALSRTMDDVTMVSDQQQLKDQRNV
jgi:hypothetical protein